MECHLLWSELESLRYQMLTRLLKKLSRILQNHNLHQHRNLILLQAARHQSQTIRYRIVSCTRCQRSAVFMVESLHFIHIRYVSQSTSSVRCGGMVQLLLNRLPLLSLCTLSRTTWREHRGCAQTHAKIMRKRVQTVTGSGSVWRWCLHQFWSSSI